MSELVLHPVHLRNLAKQWLLEDTSNFDYAGAVAGTKPCKFEILLKTGDSILAGIPFANAVFSQLGLTPEWLRQDGGYISNAGVIGSVEGPANHVLLSERVILNILSRASGVATAAYKLKKQLECNNWNGRLAGTRKTTPGFRLVEKYALIIAGVEAHRYDLSSMVMLKDNHIAVCESVKNAVTKARQLCGFSQKIEVECSSLEQALEAAEAGCDVVMFDNLKPEELHKSAEALKKAHPNVLIEASGGITPENIVTYASSNIDIISTSSLVQGYKTLDISMNVCH